MCGRFAYLFTWKELHRLFRLTTPPVEITPRYNVAPTQTAPVVRAIAESQRELALLRWGLIPSWAKDARIASSTINARAEGIAERPAFRSAFRQRRCVVPISGFYEWLTVPDGASRSGRSSRKQPMYITSADGAPLPLAGLWESWRDPAAPNTPPVESFTIITTAPNELLARIHDRMPAILQWEDVDRWLNPAITSPDSVEPALQPYPAELLLATPVSTRVNSPRNDDAQCLQSPPEPEGHLFS